MLTSNCSIKYISIKLKQRDFCKYRNGLRCVYRVKMETGKPSIMMVWAREENKWGMCWYKMILEVKLDGEEMLGRTKWRWMACENLISDIMKGVGWNVGEGNMQKTETCAGMVLTMTWQPHEQRVIERSKDGDGRAMFWEWKKMRQENVTTKTWTQGGNRRKKRAGDHHES